MQGLANAKSSSFKLSHKQLVYWRLVYESLLLSKLISFEKWISRQTERLLNLIYLPRWIT